MNEHQEKDDHNKEQIHETNQTLFSKLKIKLKQFFQNIPKYFSSIWNCVEFIGLTLYYIGLILRFIPNNMNTFIAARYLKIRIHFNSF